MGFLKSGVALKPDSVESHHSSRRFVTKSLKQLRLGIIPVVFFNHSGPDATRDRSSNFDFASDRVYNVSGFPESDRVSLELFNRKV